MNIYTQWFTRGPRRAASSARVAPRKPGSKWLWLALALASSSLYAAPGTPDPALLARGAYLAKAADCAACHHGTGASAQAYAGGLGIDTPFGTIVASNITPSLTAGIGAYSEQDFARALTQGIRRDGSLLYPAMPYPSYAGLSADDLKALYAYFMHGVAPVEQAPPATRLAFPYSVRAGLAVWNKLFLRPGGPAPVAGLSPQLERGRYLVDVLGHCGACHTPHNLAMAEESSRYLRGGVSDGWQTPDISSDPVRGIGGWTVPELTEYLGQGHASGKAVAAGGMAEVVERSLHGLNNADLQAMALYLKQVPTAAAPSQAPASYAWAGHADADQRADLAAGRSLYAKACAACHRLGGEGGNVDYFPSLIHNSTVGADAPTNLVQVILHGIDRASGNVRTEMPAFGPRLSDQQIADIANYTRARFGRETSTVHASQVADLRRGGTPGWLRVLTLAAPWLVLVLLLVLIYLGLRRLRAGPRSR